LVSVLLMLRVSLMLALVMVRSRRLEPVQSNCYGRNSPLGRSHVL